MIRPVTFVSKQPFSPKQEATLPYLCLAEFTVAINMAIFDQSDQECHSPNCWVVRQILAALLAGRIIGQHALLFVRIIPRDNANGRLAFAQIAGLVWHVGGDVQEFSRAIDYNLA